MGKIVYKRYDNRVTDLTAEGAVTLIFLLQCDRTAILKNAIKNKRYDEKRRKLKTRHHVQRQNNVGIYKTARQHSHTLKH